MSSAKPPLVIVSREKEIALLAVALGYQVLGLVDASPDAGWGGLAVLGADADWPEICHSWPGVLAAVAIDSPKLKAKLIPAIYGLDQLASLVSPAAVVGPGVVLGSGCLVQHGAVVTTDVRLGIACKLNIGAAVHHDCEVGDFCTLAPACRLLGTVKVEDRVFIGAGAIVLPHRHIGAGAIIGAGAVVSRDVAAGETVAGIPARKVGSP